jgi:hypothetical protein
MAEGAYRRDTILADEKDEDENRMRELAQSTVKKSMCEDHRFRKWVGSECFRGTCRTENGPGQDSKLFVMSFLTGILTGIFARRGHTNTWSIMEYPAVICAPATPSSCPLLALPPSQTSAPAAHRPLGHVLLQLQSCKMNNSRPNMTKRASTFTAAIVHKTHLQRKFPPPRRYLSCPNLTPTRTLLPGMVPKTLKTRKTGRFCTDGVSP